jgi:protein-L-isoaspartate(D-aspartate) O-methyltransferase
VTAAVAAVSEDDFVRRAEGTQSTAAAVTARLIDMLDVQMGMRVLEIGTGSGYSTALLAELVGPSGHVSSVDVDAEHVDRVASLLTRQGASHATLTCGDVLAGAPDQAPFDRIIAWATAPHLPAAWVEQSNPGALILTPVALTPLAKVGGGLVAAVGEDGQPSGRTLFPVRYVEMPGAAARSIDASRTDDEGQTWWLSREDLRTGDGAERGEELLGLMIRDGRQVAGPLVQRESVVGLTGWLMATGPAGLTTAALGDTRWRIGISTDDGAALMSTFDGTDTAIAGDDAPAFALAEIAQAWREAGKPGLGGLQPVLIPTEGGWTARAELRPSVAPPAGAVGDPADNGAVDAHAGHQH